MFAPEFWPENIQGFGIWVFVVLDVESGTEKRRERKGSVEKSIVLSNSIL